MIVPKALEKTYAPSVQDQMRNTEIAYAKNRRAQKKFERELYGPFGIETIRKHKLTNIDDERGMLEYELQRMHREAKKNALLAEAEGRIQARAEKNTQQKEDFNVIASIEEYERKALIEEAQADMLEDEKEKQKKQRLLGDFGRNFYGYISRPGQNTSQLSQSKLRKDLERKVKYYALPRSHKLITPHVKRQIDIEKRRQETELESLIKEFGERENPKFTTNEIDPLLKSIQNAEKLKNANSFDTFQPGFGQAAPWRPRSGRNQSRMSQIDHYNYINNLLPRISEQASTELGQKDRRGLFVDASKQDALLAQLGLDKDDKVNTDFESIFNPDGSLRAEHGIKADGAILDIDDSKLSRYVKTNHVRFTDVEVSPNELFNEMKASQVMRNSSSMFEDESSPN